jgi:predicted Co/Zn/Cd cation transporter (cation efflux family)
MPVKSELLLLHFATLDEAIIGIDAGAFQCAQHAASFRSLAGGLATRGGRTTAVAIAIIVVVIVVAVCAAIVASAFRRRKLDRAIVAGTPRWRFSSR